MTDRLFIDLSGIAIDEVELLAQEGSRALPEFAASCGTNCNVANACSCTIKPAPSTVSPVDSVEN